MNRKHYVAIAWVFVAMLSFGLGYLFNSGGNGTDSGAGKADLVNASPIRGLKGEEAAAPPVVGLDQEIETTASNSVLELTSVDIEELGKTFQSEVGPIERRLAFSKLLEGLTVDNALEIRAQIEHMPGESAEFREFHFAWGKIGGVDAIMYGADTEKSDMAPALAGWASANPQAAVQWLENADMENNPSFDVLLKDRGIPVDRLRAGLVEGLVQGLASSDTGIATDFVYRQAESGNEQAESLLGIVTRNVLRAKGPVDATAWAEALPEGGLRSTAMGRVAYSYAEQDPQAAAAWASSYVYDENGGRLVHGVTKQWAREDGASAVAWLDGLDDAPGRTSAYYSAFERWTEHDPMAASEHLSVMPESPARDSAISGMVNRFRWEDPVSAIAWADSISSERARMDAITRAGRSWISRDPSAALEWVAVSGLSQAVQQAILSPPRRGKK